MPNDTDRKLLGMFEPMETDRQLFEPLWRDVSLLAQPSRSTEEDRQRGRDRSIQLYDDTAIIASTRLASGLFNNMTSPAMEWFVLQPVNAFSISKEAKLWLEDAQQLALSIFRLPSSGFNTAISECFTDLASFGTCMMFISGEDFIRFNSLPIRQLYIAQDHFGRINTVVRKVFWTANQAASFFGPDNLTVPAKKEYESTSKYVKQREYLHFVLPIEDVRGDPQIQLPVSRRFASIYMDRAEGERVRVGGFDTFPYAVGRWKVGSGEIYGTGPAVEIIDEIRLAQSMKKTLLEAAALNARPPYVYDDDTVVGNLNQIPGGVTYVQPGKTIEQLPIGGDPRISFDQLADVRAFIQSAFFNDILEIPQLDRQTAFEVAERRNDKLQALSPFSTRIQEELLGVAITRTLDLAIRKRMLSQPPEELRGGNITIEYVSPLAISQRSSRIQAVQIWINSLIPFIDRNPRMVHKINTDNLPDYLADALNVPPELVRTNEEAEQLAAAQEEAERLRLQSQAGRDLAETVKTAAEAGEIAGRIPAA